MICNRFKTTTKQRAHYKVKLTAECQLVPNRPALCGRQSIALRLAPGQWDSERNQLLPTTPTHTHTYTWNVVCFYIHCVLIHHLFACLATGCRSEAVQPVASEIVPSMWWQTCCLHSYDVPWVIYDLSAPLLCSLSTKHSWLCYISCDS